MFNIFKKTKKEPENLQEVIEQINKLEKNLGELAGLVQEMRQKDKKHIQKIGVIRYNPFKDAGGDQSFSVAILDEGNNGVVITGLYGRDGNRIYAKPIKNGNSSYQLSDEEKKAIDGSLTENNKIKNQVEK